MRIPTVLNRSGPWVDGLFAHTKGASDHKRFVTDPKVRLLLPVISGSIKLGRILGTLRSRYHAALTALDNLGLGVFILDSLGRVVELNSEAQSILDHEDGLYLSPSGYIATTDPQANLDVQRSIHAQLNLARKRDGGDWSLSSVPRPSGNYEYLVSARALKDVDGELEEDFSGVFVTVIDPARTEVLSSDGLSVLGGLTNAESRITQLLIDGLKISDIAEHRDVSIETVRSQVKTLFQKLRCHSQSDVIRAAASTRLPLVETKSDFNR